MTTANQEPEVTDENYEQFLPSEGADKVDEDAVDQPLEVTEDQDNVSDEEYDPGESDVDEDEEADQGEDPDAVNTVDGDDADSTTTVTTSADSTVTVEPAPATGPVLSAGSATTTEEKAAVVFDASGRSWRTFVQGLAIDLLIAVVVLLVPYVAGINTPDQLQWTVIGFALGKTIVQALLSYLMRYFGIGQKSLTK